MCFVWLLTCQKSTSISADGLNLCDLEIMSFLPDTLRPIPESEPLGLDEVKMLLFRCFSLLNSHYYIKLNNYQFVFKEEWLNPGIIVEPLWDYKICEASDTKTLL